MEQSYDDRLTGLVSGPLDIATVGTFDVGDEPLSPLGLQPVRLTIDAGLQRQLEKELAAAKIANGSPRVSGLVMDPDTGAILAWASMPSYDANDFRNEIASRGLAALRDPIASDAYEPGSVMKALTTAAALHRGPVQQVLRAGCVGDAGPTGGRLRGHVERRIPRDTVHGRRERGGLGGA